MKWRAAINYIPHFIANKTEQGQPYGKLRGTVIFADISGFTGISEECFMMGKKGAELLKEILNRMFTAMILQVEGRGGFIANFAGDAFTAIFEGEDTDNAIAAGHAISKVMQHAGRVTVSDISHQLSVKVGIAYGEVTWNIFGDSHMGYVFKGEPMKNAALAEQQAGKGNIVLHSSMPQYAACQGSKQDDFCIMHADSNVEIADRSIAPGADNDIQMRFVDTAAVGKAGKGEFREVVSLFISYSGMKTEIEKGFVNNIIRTVSDYGGYLSLIDYGDKGNVIFIIFGAPLSYEDNIKRAVDFALKLKKEYGEKIKAGITFGRVYAGLIGSDTRANYTVIGDRVNTAARFMQNAKWGSIWISEEIGRHLQMTHNISYMGTMNFKGKTEPIQLFELIGVFGLQDIFYYESGFIGRQREKGIISETLKRVSDSRKAEILYVYGEPGIGKTRLTFEVLKESGETIEKLIMKCDDILRKSLNPLEYMFKYYFHIADEAEENEVLYEKGIKAFINSIPENDSAGHFVKSELERFESVIAGMIGLKTEGTPYERMDSKARFDNFILAVSEFLKGISMLKPAVVVIEDMQWMDQDTANVLPRISAALNDFPVLFICTTRMNDDGSKPRIQGMELNDSEIDLDKMDSRDIDSFISQQLPYAPDGKLRKTIIEKTEGNPFYMEQLCLYLLENDMLEQIDNRYSLKKGTEDMPKGIYSVIISRVDRLSDELRDIVQNAAVIGRQFDVRILSMMLSGKMLSNEMIVGEKERIWNAVSEVQYIFKHALLRDAVYQMQLHKRLQNLHLLAAESIMELYGDIPQVYADLARHYEYAEKRKESMEYYKKAGDFAKNNFRNEEALEHYFRYLKFQDDELEAYQVNMEIGEIYELTGDWVNSAKYFKAMMELSTKHNMELKIADTMNRYAFILNRLNKSHEALDLYFKSIPIFEKYNNHRGMAGVYNNIGITYETLEDDNTAIGYYNKALDYIKDKPEDIELLKIAMYTYNNMGYANQKHRKLEEAKGYFEKSMEISDKLNVKRNVAILNTANIYYLKNDFNKAVELYSKMLENARDVGDRYLVRVVTNNLGSVETMHGRYAKALEYYKSAYETAESLHDIKGMRMILANMGDVNGEMGNLDIAEEYFTKSLGIADEINDLRGACIARGNLGSLYNITGRHRNAVEILGEAISRAEKLDLPFYRFTFADYLIDAHLHLGEIDQCTGFLDIMNEISKRDDMKEMTWRRDIAAARIMAASGDEHAIEAFNKIIDENKGEDAEAFAMFEIAMLKKDRDVALKARELFEKCNERTLRYMFTNNIRILNETFKLDQ